MSRAKKISERLKDYKEVAGDATVVAVSKYTDLDSVITAYNCGHRDFGESRVQDFIKRANELHSKGLSDINWHFIGHLQTNKVKKLLATNSLKYIHSIDSFKILETIIKNMDEFQGDKLELLFQLKTSSETEKYGADFSEIKHMVQAIIDYGKPNLCLTGLMTIGQIRTDNFEDDARASFKELKNVAKKIEDEFTTTKLKLSMGMSQDYKIAIEEGSSFIRIGRGIFS